MSPNTWVIEMPTQKARSHPYPRRISPYRAPGLNRDAFSRDAPPMPPRNHDHPAFEDIRTILSVLKASGLMPIYEQISNYEVGPPTKTNEFYSFFVRGVVHALTIFNVYSLFTPISAQLFFSYRETDNVNQWIELLLCILTYTLTVFVCARNTTSMLRIMNEILQLDEEVRRQFGANLNQNFGFSVKFLVGIAACQAYIIVLKIYAVQGEITPTSYILLAFYGVQNGLTATYIVFASALLRIVYIRFHFINQLLNGYTYAQQQKRKGGGARARRQRGDVNSNTNPALMEHFPEDSLFIYRMHNKLLRIYKGINDCCNLILVSFLGYSFYTVTTNCYNLFVQITGKGMVSPNILQWCFAWLCLHVSLLALLSRSCGLTTREANSTSLVLARVYAKSKEYQNIIDKFLTKSIKQELQFTAYGFFAIDNSTLFKIFSAVTTYLVILIQFKQLEDSKVEDPV
ncbi:gustatory and pheromone receptor 32a [Drosophila santomea]|uniref:gustatory and pheromone receptor 32a n=1 Tax=Drosophila santomea TaxID=129105 RepID=UPI0019530018|nr:gustatory and pheromone receptor 32a [Drosophila santomea]XP_039502003.1 gustatory and pheromone receptor 32a [Drosophila santomea]